MFIFIYIVILHLRVKRHVRKLEVEEQTSKLVNCLRTNFTLIT